MDLLLLTYQSQNFCSHFFCSKNKTALIPSFILLLKITLKKQALLNVKCISGINVLLVNKIVFTILFIFLYEAIGSCSSKKLVLLAQQKVYLLCSNSLYILHDVQQSPCISENIYWTYFSVKIRLFFTDSFFENYLK